MNNVHSLLPTGDTHEFRRPVLDPNSIREAVFLENGEDVLAEAQRKRFESQNPGLHENQARIELADTCLTRLCRELKEVHHLLDRTHATQLVVIAEHQHRLPRFHIVSGGVLMAAAGGALAMSNQVGAKYLVSSGSDLFAADPTAASMFMGVLPLAGAMLKVFEARLPSDAAKTLYAVVLFIGGLGAFLLWATMMAFAFAPNPSETAWLLDEGAGHERIVTTLLLIGHILTDVACGYGAFAGAEQMLLAGRKRELRRNPLHEHLGTRASEIQAAIEEWMRTRGLAEDFLRRFVAAADEFEMSARISFRGEAIRLKQASEGAAASARVKFLNG